MSLPQPACGEPLSPVLVPGVWVIHMCFPYELFHSYETRLPYNLISTTVFIPNISGGSVKAKSTHNHYTIMAEHLLFHVSGGSMM
jgi:hypothetical protein